MLKVKWEEQGSQNILTADDPSYEGPSTAHRLSFLGKKEKRKIIVHCRDQS